MRERTRFLRASLFCALPLLINCGGSDEGSGSGSGGKHSGGGTPTSGGGSALGGTVSTGSGGATRQGGAPGHGGAPGQGGHSATSGGTLGLGGFPISFAGIFGSGGGGGNPLEGCHTVPQADAICTAPQTPHFYACVGATPPSDCVLINVGNLTDVYCCP